MPYIKSERRLMFEEGLEKLNPECAGDLNYIFSKLILHYFVDKGGMNYQLVNDAIGALEGCKLEMYRRFAAPYEDKKSIENGDI